MRAVIIIVSAATMVVSCTRKPDPCTVDELFCKPVEDWAEIANDRSTENVIALYDLDRSFYRPASDVFKVELGTRGEDTAASLVAYAKKHSQARNSRFYSPIIRELLFSSRYDFCASGHRNGLIDVLTQSNNSKSVRDLNQLCSKLEMR